MLSLGPNTVIIEEQEVAFYHLLTDLGVDVITVPFKNVVMFGGALHCFSWDIKRDEVQTDYFPIQDYDKECASLGVYDGINTKPADPTLYERPMKKDMVEEFRRTLPLTLKK